MGRLLSSVGMPNLVIALLYEENKQACLRTFSSCYQSYDFAARIHCKKAWCPLLCISQYFSYQLFDGGEMIRPMSLEKQKIKCWGYDPEEATKLFK
jgi:hypothetical protein